MDFVRMKRGESTKIRRSPRGRVIIPELQVSERGTVVSVTLVEQVGRILEVP